MAPIGVRPARVTSDKANCYPPALRTLLPEAEHRSSKYLNNGLERDHQFLKGRVRPMRRLKATETASTVCCGDALIRDFGRGFSRLTAGARRACAWPPPGPQWP